MTKLFKTLKIKLKLIRLDRLHGKYVSKALKHQWAIQSNEISLQCDQLAIKEYEKLIDQLKSEL